MKLQPYDFKNATRLLCVFHSHCADGFGAAWVVREAVKRSFESPLNAPLHVVEFHAGKYGEAPPDVTGRDVILVDFSYKRPVLLDMAAKAKSITIIDHHKTAAEDLIDLPPNVSTHFDMNHSGAMLTWLWLFPAVEPPQLIRHIEDRDLWKFEIEHTREIQAAVFSFPYDFEVWDKLMSMDATQLANEGATIERKHFKDIHELLKVSTRMMRICGYDVPVANLPYTMSSDAGHILAKGFPFAACYMDGPDGRYFSLRSSNEGGIDVSEIAKRFGGGGHFHAAGFTLPLYAVLDFEIAK